MTKKKNPLKWLMIFIAAQMLIVALIVYLFDPFYQYHAAYFGLQSTLYDKENQVIGSIRSFSYDTVLLGSSVAENFDTEYLDARYDCQTLKIIRASGSTADLLYYLEEAHRNRPLDRVFWCMDIFALTASPQVTLPGDDTLRHLYTRTMLDDFPYLFNKDVLFMKIPLAVAYSYLDINTGGHAYDWSEGKNFGAEYAMRAYPRTEPQADLQSAEQELPYLQTNMDLILQEISSHPETEYTVFFPPYSMLWWDCGYTNGISDTYFQVLETALPLLLSCDNVKLYYFQSDRDIICELDYYMDMIHYAPEINQYILECIASDTHRVSPDNLQTVLEEMHETFDYITREAIYEYYER